MLNWPVIPSHFNALDALCIMDTVFGGLYILTLPSNSNSKFGFFFFARFANSYFFKGLILGLLHFRAINGPISVGFGYGVNWSALIVYDAFDYAKSHVWFVVVVAVTTTNQAVEALKMLRENRNKFDLVISDVNMPDIDGFKLLELVGLEMDLPVISKFTLLLSWLEMDLELYLSIFWGFVV